MDGRSGVERDQLVDSARKRYQRALAADPKNTDAQVGLARLYAQAGEKDRAVATLQAAVKAHPKDADLAHKLAGIQVKFEDWAGAAGSCKQALALDPENRTYLKTLGYCQAHAGEWDPAFDTLTRGDEGAGGPVLLARVLIDQNRLPEGRQQLKLAVDKDPQFAAAKQVLADQDGGRVNVPTQEPVMQAGGTER
jgi:tetratricopeptide (TPR) repeat protein